MNIIEAFLEKNSKLAKDLNELDLVKTFLEAKFKHKKSINFSYKQAVDKANRWVLDLKNTKLLPLGIFEEVYRFEDGYRIVKLLDDTSKDWDGHYMNNCLNQKDSEFRSDSYKNNSLYEIFSFRDQNNKPYCNIEIKNNKITQVRGRSNSNVKIKFVNHILEFLFKKNLEISTFEIHHLGFFCFDKEMTEFIKNNFEGFNSFEYKGQIYFSKYEKWRLKNSISICDENLYLTLCEHNICLEALKQLVKNGIKYSINFDYGLALAAEHGHLDTVIFLIEQGARTSDYALKFASRFGHEEIVKLLLKNWDLKVIDPLALQWAERFNHKGVVEVLNDFIKYNKDIL